MEIKIVKSYNFTIDTDSLADVITDYIDDDLREYIDKFVYDELCEQDLEHCELDENINEQINKEIIKKVLKNLIYKYGK